MAIKLVLSKTDANLFAASKFWGDPDMPSDMEYPMLDIMEGNEEYEYPMTFICQINCEDIAPLDSDNILPHEGMFYFFAALDEFLGYETPYHVGKGEWPKKTVVVKYTKRVNMETFESFIMTDEEDNSLANAPLKIDFERCEDDYAGFKLLGKAADKAVAEKYPEHMNFLQLVQDDCAGIRLDNSILHFLISKEDASKGVFKRPKGVLSE